MRDGLEQFIRDVPQVDSVERRPRAAPRAPSDPTHPILDAAEAAWFLRFTTLKAFYQAVHRYGIPHARRGARVMLFRRTDLEKFLASRTRSR